MAARVEVHVVAEVVDQVVPAAAARLGVLDHPLLLEAVALVALAVAPGHALEVVGGGLAMDQVVASVVGLADDPALLEEAAGPAGGGSSRAGRSRTARRGSAARGRRRAASGRGGR